MTELREARVLDQGYIRIVDMMPGDGGFTRAIADAARVSYQEGTRQINDDLGLVGYLLFNEHWSPFDQVILKVEVLCPNFVRDQWFRHWSWFINAESARYSKMSGKYYVPESGQIMAQSLKNKQSREGLLDPSKASTVAEIISSTSQEAFAQYETMLDLGVARELARSILPHGQYTKFVGTVTLRDLLVFLKQRLSHHAQYEIREYARALWNMVLDIDRELGSMARNYFIDSVKLTAMEWRAIRAVLNKEVLNLNMDQLDKRERAHLKELMQ